MSEAVTLTLPDLARMMRDAIRDRSYQSETRLGGAVASYLAWAKHHLAPRSLDIYELYLAALCVRLAADDPAIEDVTADMLLAAADDHPVGSYRLVRTSYCNLFNWAEDWLGVHPNPAKKLPRSRRQNMKVYDIFTAGEQAALIKTADRLPLPWVQRLRILCFIDLGIRSEEARLLRPVDVDVSERVVVVNGKGSKERMVPFGDSFFKAFVGYINRPIPNVRMVDERGPYRADVAPMSGDYLFFPLGYVKRTGAVTWADPFRPLSSRAMRSWWDRVIETSGVRYRSLHMNRHTLGTNLSDAGEGLETIQDWLGHADPSTTKIYVHNSRSRLQRGRSRLDDYRSGETGS